MQTGKIIKEKSEHSILEQERLLGIFSMYGKNLSYKTMVTLNKFLRHRVNKIGAFAIAANSISGVDLVVRIGFQKSLKIVWNQETTLISQSILNGLLNEILKSCK